MYHGERLRLHPNSMVCLSGLGPAGAHLENQVCKAVKSESSGKWLLRLAQSPDKGLKLAEGSFTFMFTLLPHSVLQVEPMYGKPLPAVVEQQGGCGRGAVASWDCEKGAVLFMERPLIVSPSGVRSMWRARWRAYLVLCQASDGVARSGSVNGQHACAQRSAASLCSAPVGTPSAVAGG